MVSDAYILGLVANATPCFGYFKGGDVCDGCALTTQCKASLEDRTGRMVLAVQAKRALEAQKQEAQKQEAQKQPGARARKMVAPVVPVASGSPDESIDDILATIDSTPLTPSTKPVMSSVEFNQIFNTKPITPEKDPNLDPDLTSFFDALNEAPVAPAAPAAPTTFPMVKVVSDSICYGCHKGIPKNTQAAFSPGKGLAHPGCV